MNRKESLVQTLDILYRCAGTDIERVRIKELTDYIKKESIEPVRCIGCRYRGDKLWTQYECLKHIGLSVDEDFFCRDGKRREE